MEFLDGHWLDAGLGVIAFVASFVAGKLYPYMKKAKEVKDVIDVTYDAMEDGKITEDELKVIIKEVKDIVG